MAQPTMVATSADRAWVLMRRVHLKSKLLPVRGEKPLQIAIESRSAILYIEEHPAMTPLEPAFGPGGNGGAAAKARAPRAPLAPEGLDSVTVGKELDL